MKWMKILKEFMTSMVGINPEQREEENLEIIENLRNELDEMNEVRIRKEFNEGIDENFDNYKPYLRDGFFYLFVEFESNIWQVVQCLTIKAYSASLTLTNHIFERLFKLALILNDAGVAPKDIKKWNDSYGPTHKYSTWNMDKTILQCHEIGLLDTEQLIKLTEYRRSIRNGFSHYDPSKILKNEDDTMDMVFPSNIPEKEVIIPVNFKMIPMLQHHIVNKFARDNAEQYFDYSIQIIRHIEKVFKTRYYEESRKNSE